MRIGITTSSSNNFDLSAIYTSTILLIPLWLFFHDCLSACLVMGIGISNPNEEFHTHMNFKGEGGNTLLHQAVRDNNTQAIEVLFNYDINPLIKNKKGEIPLDLAQGKTRDALVKGIKKKQADSKKWSAACSSSFGVIPGVFLSVDWVLVVL